MRLWLATVWLASIFYCGAIVYRPAPVHSRPAASWLKTDKVQDRLPWTCDQIRAYAKAHSPAELEAKAHNLTLQQRDAAKACLKEKP